MDAWQRNRAKKIFTSSRACAVDAAIEALGFEETTGMVSNALKMSEEELLEALEQLRKKYANTPEYKKLRQDLPKGWPV